MGRPSAALGPDQTRPGPLRDGVLVAQGGSQGKGYDERHMVIFRASTR
jgi:hypothetical protein